MEAERSPAMGRFHMRETRTNPGKSHLISLYWSLPCQCLSCVDRETSELITSPTGVSLEEHGWPLMEGEVPPASELHGGCKGMGQLCPWPHMLCVIPAGTPSAHQPHANPPC